MLFRGRNRESTRILLIVSYCSLILLGRVKDDRYLEFTYNSAAGGDGRGPKHLPGWSKSDESPTIEDLESPGKQPPRLRRDRTVKPGRPTRSHAWPSALFVISSPRWVLLSLPAYLPRHAAQGATGVRMKSLRLQVFYSAEGFKLLRKYARRCDLLLLLYAVPQFDRCKIYDMATIMRRSWLSHRRQRE